MNCPDEEDRVAYADGELPAESRDAVEQHLATCAACATYVAEMQRLTSLGRSSVAQLSGGSRLAVHWERPNWRRNLIATVAAAALVLITALIAARLLSGPRDAKRLVDVQPLTTTRSSTHANTETGRATRPATPTAANDELFERWASEVRRAPVRLVAMDEVATFQPPVDRPVTVDDLNPRG